MIASTKPVSALEIFKVDTASNLKSLLQAGLEAGGRTAAAMQVGMLVCIKASGPGRQAEPRVVATNGQNAVRPLQFQI